MRADLFRPVKIGLHLSLVFFPRYNFSLVIFLVRVFFWCLWLGRLVRLFPKKGRLKGESIHYVEFPEYNNASGRFFAFLDPEPAIREFKVIWRFVAAQERHHAYLSVLDPPLVLIVLICARVEKSILFP